MRPSISVVIPVYNSEGYLRQCLEHLGQSVEKPLEVIVVDDGSTDESPRVAKELGAEVLSTGGRSGPATARNLGARRAKGEIVYFIDADVLVKPDTVGRIKDNFEADSKLCALMGSYDDSPGSEDFLSQYRNLMHHFVHQQAQREACTFWSGCGAIRREVFLEHDGFDESYDRPAIEDIELGTRLFQSGCKMILDNQIQVKHLKKWTFWALLKADVLDRGIPWTELILRDRHMPNDLNLQLSQRVSVALAFLLCAMALFGVIYWGGFFLTPLFAMLFLVLGRFWGEAAISGGGSKRGLVWTAAVLAAIVAMLFHYQMRAVIPPLVLAYALLLMHHRYEYQDQKRRRYVKAMIVALFVVVGFLTVAYLPYHMMIYAALLIVVIMVALNNQFYLFLAAKRNRLFAVAAIPFHLLYHFYSGMSFLAGLTMHFFRSRKRSPSSSAESAAHRAPDR